MQPYCHIQLTPAPSHRSRPTTRASAPIGCVVLIACLSLVACATVPDVSRTVDGTAAAPVHIVGARGPLTAKQSKELFYRMGADGHDTDSLQRHLQVEQAIAESPLVAGNSVHVLRDGPETFAAMFRLIGAAKDLINLEYYTFEDVQHDGVHLADLLIAKRRKGVEINIIYDSVGSSDTPPDLFTRLKADGISVVEFNPINPLAMRGAYKPNDRDHRKILLVDGATAVVGGVNLSASYQSGPTKDAGEPVTGPTTAPPEYWRDTDLQIQGPVVPELQKLFLSHWARQQGPEVDYTHWFPTTPPMGTEVVRFLGSSPDNLVSRYYVAVLSAFGNADKRISLIAAYFVPTVQEKKALVAATRRGVEVRVMVPARSDSKLALAAQHSHYSRLLKAGVKIYETQNQVLHSKAIVVDGVWTIVGSSNFDHRSVLFNDEVDAVVLGTDTGAQLERIFDDDVLEAKPIEEAAWRRRPFTAKLQEMFSRITQRFL
jgi:cardiolipin synthase